MKALRAALLARGAVPVHTNANHYTVTFKRKCGGPPLAFAYEVEYVGIQVSTLQECIRAMPLGGGLPTDCDAEWLVGFSTNSTPERIRGEIVEWAFSVGDLSVRAFSLEACIDGGEKVFFKTKEKPGTLQFVRVWLPKRLLTRAGYVRNGKKVAYILRLMCKDHDGTDAKVVSTLRIACTTCYGWPTLIIESMRTEDAFANQGHISVLLSCFRRATMRANRHPHQFVMATVSATNTQKWAAAGALEKAGFTAKGHLKNLNYGQLSFFSPSVPS